MFFVTLPESNQKSGHAWEVIIPVSSRKKRQLCYMAEKKEFTASRTKVTFVDLFAGAGGISEGFLQAYTDTNYFEFLLASDINANCELTHRVRYNMQLGLSTEFICQDIMEDSFVDNLMNKIGNKTVDVVTGGPSCQSFSLYGRRKKFDQRDDLFYHYLKVIKALRPKYFVMENVKRIPYGIASFEQVRNDNAYYVDKTMYLPMLEETGNYLFLIRPRRFGKSMFVSMM